MIVLNKKKFVKNDSELIETLFQKTGGTGVGYYKVLKYKIKLYNIQKELIGVITKNGVLAKASKINGRYWYSYGTIKEVGEYDKYRNMITDINTALQLIF